MSKTDAAGDQSSISCMICLVKGLDDARIQLTLVLGCLLS